MISFLMGISAPAHGIKDEPTPWDNTSRPPLVFLANLLSVFRRCEIGYVIIMMGFKANSQVSTKDCEE